MTQGSRFGSTELGEGEHEATMHELPLGKTQPRRKLDAPLEAAVRDLQPQYIGILAWRRRGAGGGGGRAMRRPCPPPSPHPASGATPGRAAMIQPCRSVSNTSTGGSQRAVRVPPRAGSKNWR